MKQSIRLPGTALIWVQLFSWFLLGAGLALGLSAAAELLSPVTGSTAASRGSVLASILLGLWAGDRFFRSISKSSTYLTIGAAWLLLTPWTIPLLSPVGGLLGAAGGSWTVLMWLVRLLLSSILLLAPAACMGGALRALALEQGWVPGEIGQEALRLSLLGAGGAFGMANAGFQLLPWGGEALVAVVGALLIVLTILIQAIAGRTPAPSFTEGRGESDRVEFASFRGMVALVWGLGSILALMAWKRALVLVFGAFPEVTRLGPSLFLGGAAVGSILLLVSLRPGSSPPLRLPALSGFAGVAVAVTLILVDRLPLYYLSIATKAHPGTLEFRIRTWGLAAVLVVPASLALGAILPILREGRRPAGPGDLASGGGSLTGLILLGGVLASILGPVWLVPGAGFRGTLLFVSFLFLGCSAAGFALTSEAPRLLRSLGILGALLVTLAQVIYLPRMEPRFLSSGVHRYTREILNRFRAVAPYQESRRKATLAFYREGGEATVAVESYPAERSPILATTQDGVMVGSTFYDLVPQVLSAELPLILRPASRDVFMIGYGIGISAGSALLHPIASLAIAEPEPTVVEASKVFEPLNRSPRSDPRVRLRFEDPRLVLAGLSRQSLDLILSRPSAPDSAAARFLLTRSFYRLAASRLKSGGLFAQSVPLGGPAPEDLASILRTMKSVFPDVLVLQTYYQEVLLLGSSGRIEFDVPAMREAMKRKEVAEDLSRIGILEPEELVVRYRLAGKGADAFLSEGRILEDRSAPLEWVGFRPASPNPSDRTLDLLDLTSTGIADRIASLPSGADGDAVLKAIARDAIEDGDAVRAADIAETLIRRGNAADGHQILGDAHYLRLEELKAIEEWHRALESDPKHLASLVSLANFSIDRQNYPQAADYLKSALAVAPEDPELLYNHGRSLYYMKRYTESEAELAKAMAALGENRLPLGLYYLGMIQKEKRNLDGAAELLRRYLRWAYYRRDRLTPVEAEVHQALSGIYREMKLPKLADEQQKVGEDLERRLRESAEARRKATLDLLGRP